MSDFFLIFEIFLNIPIKWKFKFESVKRIGKYQFIKELVSIFPLMKVIVFQIRQRLLLIKRKKIHQFAFSCFPNIQFLGHNECTDN